MHGRVGSTPQRPGGCGVSGTWSALLRPAGTMPMLGNSALSRGGAKPFGNRPCPAERMGAFHASQCGYCTPGFVTALGAALSKAQRAGDDAPQPGPEELARCLDGNLCRQAC